MAFVKVASVNDVPEEEGKIVTVSGKDIALFKKEGKIYAIDNTCKHMGGSLSEGWLEDFVVTCPLHGWRYDIKTGQNEQFPNVKIDTFSVKVEGNDIFVDV